MFNSLTETSQFLSMPEFDPIVYPEWLIHEQVVLSFMRSIT